MRDSVFSLVYHHRRVCTSFAIFTMDYKDVSYVEEEALAPLELCLSPTTKGRACLVKSKEMSCKSCQRCPVESSRSR